MRQPQVLPDAWEARVINEVFSDPQGRRVNSITEVTQVNGRPVVRMLLPEYYTEVCLSCHGCRRVKSTSRLSEGRRKAGDLGGAISIVLFK